MTAAIARLRERARVLEQRGQAGLDNAAEGLGSNARHGGRKQHAAAREVLGIVGVGDGGRLGGELWTASRTCQSLRSAGNLCAFGVPGAARSSQNRMRRLAAPHMHGSLGERVVRHARKPQHGESAMSTLTKVALGMMGRLRPKPPLGDAATSIVLPAVEKHGGLPLMDAFAQRRSGREFAPEPLPLSLLSELLWAAWGVNRSDGNRTAPTAMDCQEIDLYVALPAGAYLYNATAHTLQLAAASDVRRVTGYQDFVDNAPLDLVYVVDYTRMRLVPPGQRERYAAFATGAIAQNVYLFAASAGLSTVLRAWIDRAALADALRLTQERHVLLSQTVGFPQR